VEKLRESRRNPGDPQRLSAGRGKMGEDSDVQVLGSIPDVVSYSLTTFMMEPIRLRHR
jgi:hypothetical protein